MVGLILAGGRSTRMGDDKAFIVYHDKPHFLWLQDMLSEFCDTVYVSCREDQKSDFEGQKTIVDHKDFGENGPIAALLSAFDQVEGPILVLGCDYPFISREDIQYLIQNENPLSIATAYRNTETGFTEPLIAIYEATSKELLRDWFDGHGMSLRLFLEKEQCYKIPPLRSDALFSADTPADKKIAVKKLK